MQSQLMNRTSTTPLRANRTLRRQGIRNLTSLPAGKMVPLTAIPLFREDGIRRSRVRCSFEMMETVELLMNAVHVDVKAYLVPNLAFDRFDGMDALNRSYMGQEYPDGSGTVIPFVEQHSFGLHGSNEVYTYMGLHAAENAQVNTAYLEAYNQIWNFRAANRSADITLRDRLATDLAPAFWKHQTFAHIVPDFDQAVIDGEVALNVAAGALPVRGIGKVSDAATYALTNQAARETGGTTETYASAAYTKGDTSDRLFVVEEDPNNPGFPAIFAEMQENGITVSLANIELAKKTQAFAKMRERYTGHSDDYIIDLLMNAISVPEQAWRQPILVGQNSTVFGMSKRYATDGGNLAESVVNGATFVDLSVNVPRVPVGGVVMIVAEITPEQLFERQKDHYFHASAVSEFPEFLRDELDPEKVSVVTNDHVDIDHDTPADTFGYAPMNYQWDTNAPKIGGRFYRPKVDASFDEDRQRIWAVETENPKLTEDFYLATTMHTKPFADTQMDPFEVVTIGECLIEGNTVFGGLLVEAQDNYAAVLAEAPQERIEKA